MAPGDVISQAPTFQVLCISGRLCSSVLDPASATAVGYGQAAAFIT